MVTVRPGEVSPLRVVSYIHAPSIDGAQKKCLQGFELALQVAVGARTIKKA